MNRDYVVGQIKFACTEIIKIVENRDEENSSADAPSLYSTMEKVLSIDFFYYMYTVDVNLLVFVPV